MALDLKPGKTVTVTINKHVSRESARKTLERLFLKDKAVCAPLDARSANFIPLPKSRGGCIWTKRCNKVHPAMVPGATATFKMTPQSIKDLNSVATFVELA